MSVEKLEKILFDNNLYKGVKYNLRNKIKTFSNEFLSDRIFSKIYFYIDKNRFSNCNMLVAALISDNIISNCRSSEEFRNKRNYFKFYFFDDDFTNKTDNFLSFSFNKLDDDYEPIFNINEFKNFLSKIKLNGIDFDFLDNALSEEVKTLNSAKERIEAYKNSITENEKIIKVSEDKIKRLGTFLKKENENRPKRKK